MYAGANFLIRRYCRLRTASVAIALALFCVLGAAAPVQSSDQESDYSQELDEVRWQIKQLKQDASEYKEQRQTVEKDIADLENRLASIESRRTELKQEFAQHSRDQNKLQERKQIQISNLEEQSVILQNLIQASFAISRLDYLKILLSEDNPSRLSRTVAYYRYLTHARTHRIEQLQKLGRELDETENSLRLNRAALEDLSIKLSNQHDELRDLKKDMKIKIARFDQQLKANQASLSKMKTEETRLLELIESLKRRQVAPSRSDSESFVNMKGKLSLPLKSKIQARFGQQKQIRGAYWNGLLLSSTSGQEVRSIFTGQVVYSGFFEGFGVLVIVDHGEEFMSLYAYNSDSKVQVGDWVDTQQTIASAGGSSGLSTSGLYFELRREGSPIDPLLWCRL